MRYAAGRIYIYLFLLKLSFAVFVPAILAIVHLLSKRCDRTGLLGGALALIGCLAGSGIVTASLIEWSLESAAFDESVIKAIESALLAGGVREYVLMYPLPGLAFPAGLVILSLGLFRSKITSNWLPFLLALGAILFPVGRIGGSAFAVIACGAALSLAMGAIGWKILNHTISE